ncbi:hypothetical protein [Solibacillus sp. FSL H8-0538]|uniref:hypothetical protein n=1 Tax=Solibacillus sp. FSL H8-0538 TaxID=2921400 RepID=UPI0030FACC7A
MKNGHGYDMASVAGLFGMEIQGATTIFAVNLKQPLKVLNEKEYGIEKEIRQFLFNIEQELPYF